MATCEYQQQIEAIIVNGNAKLLVDTAQNIAKKMVFIDELNGKQKESKSVSTSQIRNIYGTSKKIEMSLKENNVEEKYNQLILLKPKMAYANGRFNKNNFGKDSIPGFTTLVNCLSYAIDKVEGKQERMKYFFNFFEAILAYHKAEGGK